jgi:hypothetical protein
MVVTLSMTPEANILMWYVTVKKGYDVARPKVDTPSRPPSPTSGPITRAHTKAIKQEVNSLLLTCNLDTPLDGMILNVNTICVIMCTTQELHPWSQATWEEEVPEGESRVRWVNVMKLEDTNAHTHTNPVVLVGRNHQLNKISRQRPNVRIPFQKIVKPK